MTKKNVLKVCLVIFSYLWKAGAIITGLFCIVIGFFVAKLYYEENYGISAHRDDIKYNDRISAHIFKRNKVKLYDRYKDEYISQEFRWVSGKPEYDSIGVYCTKNGLRGFFNVNDGSIVSEPKYLHAWVYSEGLAAVVDLSGKMGFIDKNGEFVIKSELPFKYDHDYVFKHGVCCIEYEKMGLLKKDGTWAIPTEYDFISYLEEPDVFILYKDKKAGAVKNETFEWLFPLEYDDIDWTETDKGNGFELYRDYTKCVVAADGVTVLYKSIIDQTENLYLEGENKEELIKINDIVKFKVGERWGVMNTVTGRIVIPARYFDIDMLSQTIVKCIITKNDTYYDIKESAVFYNTKGEAL